MASVSNRPYPDREHQHIIATTLQGTTLTGSTLQVNTISGSASTISGSAIYAQGCIVLRGIYTATGSISAGDVVFAYTGSSAYVKAANADEVQVIGVAEASAAEGAAVNVIILGVAELTASGSITAGDLVVTASTGSGFVFTGSTAAAARVEGTVVGRALDTATNGNSITVFVNPQ